MYSVRRTAVLPAVGFPIRVSADHRPFSASSRLIAAVHALLRLLVPRHPPCALDILTVILIDLAVALPKDRSAPLRHDDDPGRGLAVIVVTSVCWMTVQFSRSGKRAPAGDSGRRSLKTQQHAGADELAGQSPGGDLIGRRTSATSSSVDVRNLLEGSSAAVLRHSVSRQALQSWSSLERR
jgi:hypothetical protein